MYPFYEGFKDDLTMFNNNIATIAKAFKAMPKDDLNPIEEEMAHDLKKNLENINIYIKAIVEEPVYETNDPQQMYPMEIYIAKKKGEKEFKEAIQLKKKKDREKAWKGLLDALNSIKKVNAEISNEMLESEGARTLYDLNQSMKLLGGTLDLMAEKEDYFTKKEAISKFLKKKEEYDKALATFTEDFEYLSYEAMVKELREAESNQPALEAEYKKYEDGRIVEEAKNNYVNQISICSSVERESKNEISALEAEIKAMAKRLEEAKKTLDDVTNKDKAEKDARVLQYNKALAEGLEKKAALNDALKKLEDERLRIWSNNENADAEKENYRQNILELENAKAVAEEDETYFEARSKFIAALRQQEEIEKLLKEYREKLDEMEYTKKSGAEMNRKAFHGKTMKNNPDKIKLFDERGKKQVKESVEFYDKLNTISYNILDRYAAVMGMSQEENKQMVKDCPTVEKLYAALKNKGEELSTFINNSIVEFEESNPYSKAFLTYYLKWKGAWTNTLMIEDAEKHIAEIEANKKDIEKKIGQIDWEIDQLEKKIPISNYVNTIATENAKIKELPAAMEEKKKRIEELKQRIVEEKAKWNKAESDWKAAVSASNRAKNNYIDNRNKINKITADKKKIDKFAAKHREVANALDDLARNHSIRDGKVMSLNWADTQEGMVNDAKAFLGRANVGKREGHTNTNEFNNMVTALKKFKEFSGDGYMSCEKLMENMNSIGKAAQEYIDAKNAQFFVANSTMRQVRMDYAYRIREFAKLRVQQIKEMKKMDDTLDNAAKAVKSGDAFINSNPSYVYSNVIKPAIKKALNDNKMKFVRS